MAKSRRRTFWRNALSEIVIDSANFETPVATVLDGENADASLSLYTRDAVPTLLNIRGTLIMTMVRGDAAPSAAPETEALEWAVGFSCVHGIDAMDPFNDLEDEFWLQTFAGRLEAQDVAIPMLKNDNSLDYRYSLQFCAPYPNIREVNSRAKRRFEDPCNLMLNAYCEVPAGLDEPASFKVRFIGRTLWLAS